MRYLIFIFGIFVLMVFTNCTGKKVNLEMLLTEMTYRTELTYYPENSYSLNVSVQDYKWKNSSMYFGASWHEYNQLNTAKDESL